MALRPYLTAYVNLCWVIGQLIASGVLRGVLDWQSEWAFRVPFALQCESRLASIHRADETGVWPPLILVPCLFAPDSPWWLVRKGRIDGARNALRRLRTGRSEEEIEQEIAFMQHTNAHEKSVGEGTSYLACFKGVDLRRTEVAMGAWICQNWCGSSFMGWSTYFLERAGLATSNAFTMTIGQYALGAVGTLVSWFLMTYIGRRKLYLSGLSIQTVILIIIGGLGFASRGSMGASWAIGALLLVYTAVYDATVGPVCYAIVAECSSTRLRAKTIVLARIVYNIAGIINFIKMPYFLNADERKSVTYGCGRLLTSSGLGRKGWTLLGRSLLLVYRLDLFPSSRNEGVRAPFFPVRSSRSQTQTNICRDRYPLREQSVCQEVCFDLCRPLCSWQRPIDQDREPHYRECRHSEERRGFRHHQGVVGS